MHLGLTLLPFKRHQNYISHFKTNEIILIYSLNCGYERDTSIMADRMSVVLRSLLRNQHEERLYVVEESSVESFTEKGVRGASTPFTCNQVR